MAAIYQRTFSIHFLEWSCVNFDYDFTKFVPKGPINNIPSLVQTMAPSRRQAIIWTNDGYIIDAVMRWKRLLSFDKVGPISA